jgi:hypothetical protein
LGLMHDSVLDLLCPIFRILFDCRSQSIFWLRKVRLEFDGVIMDIFTDCGFMQSYKFSIYESERKY